MIKIFTFAVISIYTILNLNNPSNLEVGYKVQETFSQDTSKYLIDNFVLKKAKFQHRELRHLIGALKLKVKSYNFVLGKKRGEVRGITIFFEKKEIISSKMDNSILVKTMFIEFEKPISLYEDVTKLADESKGEWLPADESFYGKQLVKDIRSGK